MIKLSHYTKTGCSKCSKKSVSVYAHKTTNDIFKYKVKSLYNKKQKSKAKTTTLF